ncbi:MAG: hypothetical protein M3N29_01405 [Chloroflexota bacterium]|nr:hypothetical protein [Chloroflexota bacterium]
MFLVGLLGWLVVGAVPIAGIPLFVAAFLLGAAAGVAGRPLLLLPALWLGMLASYPAALALHVIVFLSENWAIYVVLFLFAAAIGFALSFALIQLIGRLGTATTGSRDR